MTQMFAGLEKPVVIAVTITGQRARKENRF